MSYRNTVAAAICGHPDAIKKFTEKVKKLTLPDKLQLLNHFRVIKLEKNFAVFALYLDWGPWDDEAEVIWKTLCKLSREAKLSYIFYRLGEDYGDYDIHCDFGEEVFKKNVFELFKISRGIVFGHPKLNVLKGVNNH